MRFIFLSLSPDFWIVLLFISSWVELNKSHHCSSWRLHTFPSLLFSSYFICLELKSILQQKIQYNCHPHHKSFSNLSVNGESSFLRILKSAYFFISMFYSTHHSLPCIMTLCMHISSRKKISSSRILPATHVFYIFHVRLIWIDLTEGLGKYPQVKDRKRTAKE